MTVSFAYGVCVLFQFRLDGFALCLVAWLVEQCEHILLVGLYSRLVEWVHAEDVAADAARFLEEIDDFAEAALCERAEGDVNVGHSAVYVGDYGAEFCRKFDSSR